jgi:hypothetical protein
VELPDFYSGVAALVTIYPIDSVFLEIGRCPPSRSLWCLAIKYENAKE